MRKHGRQQLEPARPPGMQDLGIVTFYSFGHATRRPCTRISIIIRKEDEPEPPLEKTVCEACGVGLVHGSTYRALAELSASGVLAYRLLLTKEDGKEQPVGPRRYLPVGAWR